MPKGGFRSGAGRPRKDLAEAMIDGTRPSRLKSVDAGRRGTDGR